MTKDVARARGGAAGERRLVTIMFCDLVGSTVLSQRLDQEDYAEVVLSYQHMALEIIERNGGIVANYSGDGVVAQFGYPDSYENDAERAVVSGLEVCEALAELNSTLGAELGEQLECRVGLHASVSVVGMMAADRNDMSIFGDTANIASRVEGVAKSGEVFATKAVIDLLKGEFETTDDQVVELKGVAQPMPVARIVGRATTPVLSAPELHVGRERTLSELGVHWQRADGGHGSFVTVCAEAGVGKSAVVRAFVDTLDDPVVVSARGRSLSMSQPFAVLGQLAQACLDHDRVSQRAEVRGAALAVREQVGAPVAPGASAEEHWQQVFEAGMQLLEALVDEPVIIVVEDLHWTDSSTEELIERFAKTINNDPCLLLTTMRPGPTLGTAILIELEPLSDDEMRTLVREHAVEDLPASLVDEIVSRAQGVPMFAVELARGATSDEGVGLPDTLQASLLTRLTQRPELARVAQVASVLGDEVDLWLLSSLLESTTAEVDRQLTALDGDHVLERDGHGGWQFAHALLREAIYASMLRRERRSLHQSAAATLTADGARDDERISVVGYHLAHGARRLEAAGCYDLAARRAARMGAFHDAVDLVRQGTDVLGDDPEPTDELLGLTITKGNATFATIGYAAPGMNKLWRQAEAVAAHVGNQLEQSSGMNGQSVAALFDGEYELAVKRADRIVEFGVTHDDRAAQVRGHCSRAIPQLYMGRVAESLANAEQAASQYRDGDYELLTYGFGTDQLAIALTTASTAAYFADDRRSLAFGQQAIEHAQRIDSPITLAMVHNNAATMAMFADDAQGTLHHVDQVWQLCDRFDLPFFRMVTSLYKAAALAIAGEPDATTLAYEALGNAGGESKLALTLGLYAVARSEEASGNLAGAFDLAEMGLGIVEQRDERLLEVELRMMQFRCRPEIEMAERLTTVLPLAHTRGAAGSVRRAESLLDSR